MLVFSWWIYDFSGETSANKEQILQGQLDTPLSDMGVKQAELLGQSPIKHEKFHKVYASDLKRAFNTAEILLKPSEVTDNNIIADERIREKVGNRVTRYALMGVLD